MGKRIVITGASSDIGLAIADRIIADGDFALLQCFKKVDKCAKIKERLSDACEICPVDFTDNNALDGFCGKLNDTDILVNAAAVTITDLLVNLTDDNIASMISANIIALTKVCRAAMTSMVVRRKGAIVNISSVAASRGNKGQTVYAGTKGYVEAFTRSMAAEYGKRGVRVNCVAPGPIEAGSLTSLLGYAEDQVKKSVVSKRLGTPEDVAAAVAFLCGDDAGYINGRIISVDGGFCSGV